MSFENVSGKCRTSTRIAPLCTAIILFSLGLFVVSASAESVLNPSLISATPSTEWWEFGSVNVLYDGTGLTAGNHTDAMSASWGAGNYPTTTPANGMNNGAAAMATVMFTFDTAQALDGLNIWSMGGWLGGGGSYRTGPHNVLVEYSNVATPSTTADWTDWHDGTFAEQAGTPVPWPMTQALDLTNITAKHVGLSLLDSYHPTINSYVALSEVQFVTEFDPPPPPPLDLDISVGARTQLNGLQYQNTNRLSVSRMGVVAAFYQKAAGGFFRRTSTDGGLTWGSETSTPDPGNMSVSLTGGGVVSVWRFANPVGGGSPPVASDLESTRYLFSDDFSSWSSSTVPVTIPNAVQHTKYATFWPLWEKGKIIQLDNGDLLAPMFGELQGDGGWYRTMLMRSTDEGQSWQYRSTIAYSDTDPNPEFGGGYWGYAGYCEPSITQLANGQLLAMMRTQGTHIGPDYRPMYVARSDDLGLTWTEPEPTNLPLLNVWPTLITLDNGVVAVAYGRPGVHVAFSTDHGHTWSEIETFATEGEPSLTGYVDMVQAGPNELVLIGGVPGGTYVYPIRVDLAGDVDGDGFIGGDDLTIILTNWGQTVTAREQGDLNGDFFVGGDDYSEVLTHWGTGVGLEAVLASVPEPTVLLLLSWGGLVLLRRKR